jgi:hypothetical protein
MISLGRCLQSLLLATLLVGCVAPDPFGPSPPLESAEPGTVIAESVSPESFLAVPSLGDIGESAFGAPAFALNASPPTSTSALASDPKVAILTIFADPTYSPQQVSGFTFDGGTHAFITVRNNSSAPITVGRASGIQPGKTVSLGTWGNKSEHRGLWYNLEAYFIYKYSYYSGRISVSWLMSSEQLATLSSFIKTSDYWSSTSNCSTFAVNAWNKVVDYYARLSAGVPNTPKNLANSIKSKYGSGYTTRAAVPYNYVVYYNNGTTLTKSTVYK